MREWIMSLCGTALLTCMALALSPEGRAKRVVRLVCAFAMMAALIRPVAGFDYGEFTKKTARLRSEAGEYSQSLEETNDSISRLFIQEECEAYIMDKGQSLGAEVSGADVTLRWSTDGYWYPESASISGGGDGAASARLRGCITAELGIPPERITWVSADDGG